MAFSERKWPFHASRAISAVAELLLSYCRWWHCTNLHPVALYLRNSKSRRFHIGLGLRVCALINEVSRRKFCDVIASWSAPAATACNVGEFYRRDATMTDDNGVRWMLLLAGAVGLRCAICEMTPEVNGCSGNPSAPAPLRLCPSSHKHCITVTKYSIDGKWLLRVT